MKRNYSIFEKIRKAIKRERDEQGEIPLEWIEDKEEKKEGFIDKVIKLFVKPYMKVYLFIKSPRKKLSLGWLLKVKRIVAFLDFLICLSISFFAFPRTEMTFFVINAFLMLDYVWKTRKTGKSEEDEYKRSLEKGA